MSRTIREALLSECEIPPNLRPFVEILLSASRDDAPGDTPAVTHQPKEAQIDTGIRSPGGTHPSW